MTGIAPLSVKSASSESGMSLGGSTRPCPRVRNTESLKIARQSTSKERCLKYMPSLKFPACTRHNSPQTRDSLERYTNSPKTFRHNDGVSRPNDARRHIPRKKHTIAKRVILRAMQDVCVFFSLMLSTGAVGARRVLRLNSDA